MKNIYSAFSCYLLFLIFTLSFVGNIYAKPSAVVKLSIERVENKKGRETLILPYVFSTDELGTVFGVGGMVTGLHQKQMTLGGTVFGGSETKGLALGLWDYRLFDTQRFFISALGMGGKYPLLRAYSPLPEEYTPAGENRPGSNDSNFDDYLESRGTNNWWEIKLEYVLPIGNAVKQGMVNYKLQGGLLTENIEVGDWNPLERGTTVLVARQFNRYQLYQNEKGSLEGAVHALELGVLYDNTDFPVNPSQGSTQYFSFTYNPKWLKSNDEWTLIEFEASKYFSFGASDFAKQNIIALNMWASYSPSWEVNYDEQGNSLVENHAPFIEGATLGGMNRLRGFRQNRFHDKAAIYATAEYRMTLDYNPIANVNWLNFLNLDWFQTVFFVEGGRVAPTFSGDTLLEDWKADVGFSLRALTGGIVVRLDITASKEDTTTWLMVGHPF
jgi:hypothetical protein